MNLTECIFRSVNRLKIGIVMSIHEFFFRCLNIISEHDDSSSRRITEVS